MLNFRFFKRLYHGCIMDENFLYLDKKASRKLKSYSKRYDTYDMELLNTNEILIKVGNNYPFNFNYYAVNKMVFDKLGWGKKVLIYFIPMKVLVKLKDTKLNIYIRKE